MNLYAMMSVLFADLTSLGVPYSLIRERIANAVTSYGGIFDNSTAEHLVLAYFIDEDHPEQAVRSALTIQAELNALIAEKLLDHAAKRIIGVLMLSLDDIEHTPIKLIQASTLRIDEADVEETSRTLAQLCPQSGVLVHHDVYVHIRGLFDIDAVPTNSHEELPTRADWYLVKQSRPRIFPQPIHTVGGVETPLFGRILELSLFDDILAVVHQQRRLQVVTLTGPNGIGKSRLLDEFQNYLELRPESVWLFRARLEPHTQYLPYALIRQLFMFRFEIYSSDTIARARQALVEGVQKFIPAQSGEAAAHFIGHLIGLNFMYSDHIRTFAERGQPIEYRALQAIEDFLRAMSKDDPIVMLIEGIHWADNASLTLLSYIFQRCQDLPLLVMMTAHDSFREAYPTWYINDNHHQIALVPLSPETSREFLDEILHHYPQISQEIRDAILERSAGNPLLMEALIRDAIALYHDGLNSQEQLEALASDLQTALERRLNRLPESARVVLEKAACVGQIFWADAVMSLLEDVPPEDVKYALEMLTEQEFIYEMRPSSFATTTEYRFKHSTLHQLVSKNASYSPQDHLRVANWRVTNSAQRVNEYAGILAQRYELAENFTLAVEYYLRAGKQAEKVGAIREATWFYQQALRLYQQSNIEISDSKHVALLYTLGNLQAEQGDFAAADETLQMGYQLSETIGDRLLQAKFLYVMGRVAHKTHNHQLARKLLNDGIKLARQIGDRPIIAKGLHALGELALDEGDFTSAQKYFNEGTSTYQTASQESQLGYLMVNLSRLALGQGEQDKALSLARTALRIGHKNHSIKVILMALESMANILAACELNQDARLAALALLQHPIASEFSRKQAQAVLDHLPDATPEQVDFEQVIASLLKD